MKLQGIPYFPFPSVNSSVLDALEAKFKMRGLGIYIKILQEIYKEDGYYLQISDDTYLLWQMKMQTNESIIADIVEFCVQRDIFDKAMFEKYKILTSNEIQKDYITATKRRKDIALNVNYLLEFARKFVELQTKTEELHTETEELHTKTQQEKKTTENKNNITITVKNKTTPNTHSDEDLAGASLSNSKIEKFKVAFPHKLIDTDNIADGIDIDKLIQAINDSPFLRSANNFTLKVCLKYYDAIIAGKYAQTPNITVHTDHDYTKSDLDSLYKNIDDIEI